eukprot:3303728-Pyramimonas_sp.AAC.1
MVTSRRISPSRPGRHQGRVLPRGAPRGAPAFFGLRRVRASWASVSEVGGVEVSPGTWVRPRMRALPMGWSWALKWCQAIHGRAAEEGGSPAAARLADGSPPPPLASSPRAQYVNNYVVSSTSEAEVRERLAG